MEINLLEKRELRIENIQLKNVDLNDIARITAEVLGLSSNKVLVVDVRDNNITLDIMQNWVKAEDIYGKKIQLLKRLELVSGVQIFSNTNIHSEGILGMIELDEEEATKVLQKTNEIRGHILERIGKRAIIFPTGFEVKQELIKDTNTPLIKEILEREGYQVKIGEVLDDDMVLIAGNLRKAINEGYGLIITTGGVGAEDKDYTVEAVLKVDNTAAAPYIVKFQKNSGRHVKDGVKIAVGEVGTSLLIALPGPNDEVRICMEIVINNINKGFSKEQIAGKIAAVLRNKLKGCKLKHNH